MAVSNPYATYAKNNINTASKEELTLMLYDGALKFTNQAVIAVDNKDYDRANDLIIRVEEIIREFQVTLDHSYEISANFDAMYDYMHRLLVEANYKKDTGLLNEVKGYLRDFRDSWKEAMKLAKMA